MVAGWEGLVYGHPLWLALGGCSHYSLSTDLTIYGQLSSGGLEDSLVLDAWLQAAQCPQGSAVTPQPPAAVPQRVFAGQGLGIQWQPSLCPVMSAPPLGGYQLHERCAGAWQKLSLREVCLPTTVSLQGTSFDKCKAVYRLQGSHVVHLSRYPSAFHPRPGIGDNCAQSYCQGLTWQ